uniref:Cation channel sperm associated auxiliary subunit beta n=1 Tax=Lepisosteus oculatus TaxID=7918 RepID=W5N6L5_LEPOC
CKEIHILIYLFKLFITFTTVQFNLDLEKTHFECTTEEHSDRIRLYLGLENLKISCYLYDDSYNLEQQKRLLMLYTSAGLAPSMEVYNRTDSKVFAFQMSLLPNQSIWSIDIPRRNITINTAVAPVDEWYVRFSMHHGLNMFSTEGTLLDTVRAEPLLQWTIGEQIPPPITATLINHVVDLRVSKNPCANDVALLVPVFAPSKSAVMLRKSFISWWLYKQLIWVKISSKLYKHLKVKYCIGLATVDVKLTNYYLFLLTTKGLFLSQDMTSQGTGSLNFTLLDISSLTQMDYSSTTLWYSHHCLHDKANFQDDYVSLISSGTDVENKASQCLYSRDPFTEWHSCDISNMTSHRHVSFIYDGQQHTGIVLSYTQQEKGAKVSVFGMRGPVLKKKARFPPVRLNFISHGMLFHPNSHELYLYGSEVWSSADGGSSFSRIITLEGESVVNAVSCIHDQTVVFVTNLGSIYLSKADMGRYVKLNQSQHGVSTLYCDHLGSLIILSLHAQSPNGLNVDNIPTTSLIQHDDQSSEGALALQYTSDKTVLFHEHLPLSSPSLVTGPSLFSPSHVGKVIRLSTGGSGVITQVYRRRTAEGFVAVAVAEILEGFKGERLTTEPIQRCRLTVRFANSRDFTYVLTAFSPGFQDTHIGKTVVIPGSSSYLITGVFDSRAALALPTLPTIVPFNKTYSPGEWLLFNAMNRGAWKMMEGECRHTLQSLNNLRTNSLVYINLKEELTFSFKVVEKTLSSWIMKLMKFTIGNPSLLKVTTAHSWDRANNHILNITAFSNFFQKGQTTVIVSIPEASLLCTSTPFVFTLQNSCPTGLRIRYIPDQVISAHDWLHGDPRDSKGVKRLIDLPVNYRPPSQLGIAIPVSDNIYNADPSRPRPREFYQISKDTGRYKQCAGKPSAAECDCTDELRLSPLVANSDCRKRVLRFMYPVTNLNITLYITRPGHKNVPLTAPEFVTVTEVNNKTNWKITGTNAVPSMLKMRDYLGSRLNSTLYNPEGLQISCFGSELFHFQIAVVPGVLLCDMVEEVQIYVDNPPLAFPAQYLINTITAVVLGGVLLAGFFLRRSKVRLPSKQSFVALLRKRSTAVAPAAGSAHSF